MSCKNTWLYAFLTAGLAVGDCAAAPSSGNTLDTSALREAYFGGDFDKVVSDLESFNRTHAAYSHSDSLLVAKYLGIVYAASPNSREKGKYFLNLLLRLDPEANLAGMYVSDEIDRIFEKVRVEFRTDHPARSQGAAPAFAPAHATETGKLPIAKAVIPAASSGKPGRPLKAGLYSVGGVVALVGLGVAVYYLWPENAPPNKEKIYPVSLGND